MYIKVTDENSYAVKASVSIGEVTTTEGGDNQMKHLTATNVTAAEAIGDMTDSVELNAANVSDNAEITAKDSAVIAVAVRLPDTAAAPNVSNSFAVTAGATREVLLQRPIYFMVLTGMPRLHKSLKKKKEEKYNDKNPNH